MCSVDKSFLINISVQNVGISVKLSKYWHVDFQFKLYLCQKVHLYNYKFYHRIKSRSSRNKNYIISS